MPSAAFTTAADDSKKLLAKPSNEELLEVSFGIPTFMNTHPIVELLFAIALSLSAGRNGYGMEDKSLASKRKRGPDRCRRKHLMPTTCF